MQTKTQIEQLLLSAGVRPNKRFGQHFLIDLNLMRLLIETAGIQKNDVVLEVGCATGSLTEAITEKAGFCVAVEIDAVLAHIAKSQLADRTNVEIIAADVLKNKFEINPAVLDALNRACAVHNGRLLLVGNLPYAAGTPLMLNLITGAAPASCCRKTAAWVDAMFVTVQKEVADRMLAHQGSKDYGILSILLWATGDLKHIRTLKPSVFWPQPRVDSAMISYVRSEEKIKRIKNIETLSAIAAGLLQHRRKMLKSCCKLMTEKRGTFYFFETERRLKKVECPLFLNWPEIFAKCGIDSNLRPDQLTPDQFIDITNWCA